MCIDKGVDMMPRPMTITEEVEEEPLDTLYFPEDNSFCAPPIQSPIQERKREEESNGMFVDADYEGLEEELDAELSYLKAPKRPSLPRPFLPCAIMRCILFLLSLYSFFSLSSSPLLSLSFLQ